MVAGKESCLFIYVFEEWAEFKLILVTLRLLNNYHQGFLQIFGNNCHVLDNSDLNSG